MSLRPLASATACGSQVRAERADFSQGSRPGLRLAVRAPSGARALFRPWRDSGWCAVGARAASRLFCRVDSWPDARMQEGFLVIPPGGLPGMTRFSWGRWPETDTVDIKTRRRAEDEEAKRAEDGEILRSAQDDSLKAEMERLEGWDGRSIKGATTAKDAIKTRSLVRWASTCLVVSLLPGSAILRNGAFGVPIGRLAFPGMTRPKRRHSARAGPPSFGCRRRGIVCRFCSRWAARCCLRGALLALPFSGTRIWRPDHRRSCCDKDARA